MQWQHAIASLKIHFGCHANSHISDRAIFSPTVEVALVEPPRQSVYMNLWIAIVAAHWTKIWLVTAKNQTAGRPIALCHQVALETVVSRKLVNSRLWMWSASSWQNIESQFSFLSYFVAVVETAGGLTIWLTAFFDKQSILINLIKNSNA